jgi:hypothetical protein
MNVHARSSGSEELQKASYAVNCGRPVDKEAAQATRRKKNNMTTAALERDNYRKGKTDEERRL